MTTDVEELIEAQLTRCAQALDSCLDGAARARENRWVDARQMELLDATRLMDSSAKLAGALARLRGHSQHTVRVERGDTPAQKRGSNGQANR